MNNKKLQYNENKNETWTVFTTKTSSWLFYVKLLHSFKPHELTELRVPFIHGAIFSLFRLRFHSPTIINYRPPTFQLMFALVFFYTSIHMSFGTAFENNFIHPIHHHQPQSLHGYGKASNHIFNAMLHIRFTHVHPVIITHSSSFFGHI